jgi:hypothetical protein
MVAPFCPLLYVENSKSNTKSIGIIFNTRRNFVRAIKNHLSLSKKYDSTYKFKKIPFKELWGLFFRNR